MISNPNIKWSLVKEDLSKCTDNEEMRKIYWAVDRHCWDREDIDRLDLIMEAAEKRLKVSNG